MFRIRIRIRLDPFHFGQPDPDPGSKKSAKIKKNFNKNQQKSLEYHTFFKLMFTDINIYSMNNKTDHISETYILYRKIPDFRSDLEQDPDPLFHETDPRIRIQIKMKRIRGSGSKSK